VAARSARSLEEWIRYDLVASDPTAPPDVLDAIARRRRPLTKERVARNPSTPIATLRFLGTLDHVEVMRALVDNPRTPSSVLRSIVRRSTNPYIAQRGAGVLKARGS
jgi:hypothetical protein